MFGATRCVNDVNWRDGLRLTDRRLRSIPKPYLMVGLLALDVLFLWLDFATGPRIPFYLFYLLAIYFSLKYVGSGFAYGLAFLSALGKTYVSGLSHPEQAFIALELWRFVSNYSINAIFCYLLDAQMAGRARAEDALSELSQLHQSIVSETDSGVTVFKATGECVFANQAAARILGCTVEQLRQYSFRNDTSPHSRAVINLAEKALRTGVTQRFESSIGAAGGKEIWCIASISRINRKGVPLLLTVFTDMSAYKEAEQEVQRANRTAKNALDRAGVAERKIISISEETQKRIGQELHDDLGQHLTGIAFMSEVLYQKLKGQDGSEKEEASKITALINEAVSKTRQLAQGLYPVELKEGGLHAMLAHFADNVESIYKIRCEFIHEGEGLIDDRHIAINLFRIAQEAVCNAIKHGGASTITLRMAAARDVHLLEVADNGSGIGDWSDLNEKGGLGMHTMQYRASLIGATLNIFPASSGGTVVAVTLRTQSEGDSHASGQ